jgi:hypothetical protein
MFDEDEDEIENFEDETSDSVVNDIDHWNYRIFNCEDGFFTIGIVYYDKDGNTIAWNETELSPGGDSVEELINCMKLMMEATQKPVFTPPKENTL